jgi:DNA-directed RNA polymerase subunit beta'
VLTDDKDRERARFRVPYGARMLVEEGQTVTRMQKLAEWDPYTLPIITERAGKIEYLDLIEGVTLVERMDEVTGLTSKVVVDYKSGAKAADLRPRLQLKDAKGEVARLENGTDARYFLSPDSILSVDNGVQVAAGDVLARIPREGSKTRDITGGLPRVAELFEARRPKDAAEISKIDGVVDFGPSVRGKRTILIKDPQTSVEEEHLIPIGKHVIVFKGDFVKKGQQLTEGPVDPHEILDVCGPQELQEHLVNEVQEVYRLQGVTINDKHIEIIVRQMLRKVRVNEPGDTQFLWGEQIDKIEFEKENARVEKMGGKPAEAQPVLLGITKASLETESFLSAASFQDTTRVLTEAATMGKVDYLRGFKENVIMGHIIPAGTGYTTHRRVELRPMVEPLPLEEPEPVAALEQPLVV